MPQIVPAILTNNIEEYKHKISLLEKAVSRVQIDIIDGLFAKNKTISASDIASVKTDLFLEAHLMVNEPEKYLNELAKAKIQLITFHIEACKEKNAEDIIKKIQQLGVRAGIAINPETPINTIQSFIEKVDTVLVMSVHPGFSGQNFIPESLEKIKALRKLSPTISIEVDGGINNNNIQDVIEAGADYAIMGSGIFQDGANETMIKNSIETLNKKINLETKATSL